MKNIAFQGLSQTGMSLAELEARLAAVASELDEAMPLTFRARGAKLATLTARVEELEQESKQLESAIAVLKAGGGGGGGVPAVVGAAGKPVLPAHVAPEGYGRPSPAPARPPYAVPYAAAPVASSPLPQRPPLADPYASSSPMPQRLPPSDPNASSSPMPQRMPPSANANVFGAAPSPMIHRPPQTDLYGAANSPMPQRPPPVQQQQVGSADVQQLRFFSQLNQDLAAQNSPAVGRVAQQQPVPSPMPHRPPPVIAEPFVAASSPMPQRPPPRSEEELKKERKAALLQKKRELLERLNNANAGISQLQKVRVFLDRKASELEARIKSVAEREGFVHYILNQDQVIRAQRIVRKWLKRKHDPSANMLLKVVKDYRQSDVAKDAKHRWQALVEIYNSEKTYHSSLESLIKHYKRPIEAASQQPNSCIEPAQTIEIFNTIEAIAAYSSKMVERLAYATISVKKSEKMGDVFLQMIPTMALYERYFIDFETSLGTLRKLSKDKRFVELLSQCKKASGSQLTIEQLLIMPVQRLPRYSILLDALLKHTPQTHSDRASLQEALNKVKAVLTGINAKAKENETVGAVVRIAEQVEGMPSGFHLATPNRRFVRSDVLIYVVQGRIVTRRKPVFCFLFSDLLMRTKQVRGAEDEYVFRELIPLDAGTQVHALPDEKSVTNAFSITRGDKQWRFMLDSGAKRDSWLDSINEVLSPPPPAVTVAAPTAAPSISSAASKAAIEATLAKNAAAASSSSSLGKPTPSHAPVSPRVVAAAVAVSATIYDSGPPETYLPWPSDTDANAPPPLFASVKGNVTEFGGEGSSDPTVLFDAHLRTPYFEKFLRFRPHSVFLGTVNNKPLVLIVERSAASSSGSLYMLLLSANGDLRFSCTSQKALESELKKRGVEVRLSSLVRFTSDNPAGQPVVEKISKFENSRIVSAYKFGVIYWKDGQNEDEAFANQSSPAFAAFLGHLGAKIKLKGWSKYRGGLNVQNNETGEESVYTEWNGFEVMFHVSTLLPFNKADKQQLERKRHLGNDVVIVVFRERGDVPFDVSQFHSQFNHVFVVVSPLGAKGYRVGVTCKPGVPFFGPRIPQGGVFAQTDATLHDWLIGKLINGERAAMHAKDFAGKAIKTQTAQLQDIVATGGSGASSNDSKLTQLHKMDTVKSLAAVNPDDPRELQRRLAELKSREATAVASIDGLHKLSSFYSKDPKAKAESDAKVAELEKELQELRSQIAAVDSKIKESASATVTKLSLTGKTDAEKQSLIASFRGQVEKQEKTVASLEKLLGFYAKDPSGAASTKVQLDVERAALQSLQLRISELQAFLTPVPSASPGALEEQDDDDVDDGFDVDALSVALRGVDKAPSVGGVDVEALSRALKAGAVAAKQQQQVDEEAEEESKKMDSLRNTLQGLDLGGDADEENDEQTDLAGTMLVDHEALKAGDRVWILSEAPDWTYVSGDKGELYVPSHTVQKDI